jgi:hypothetical protein
MFSPSRPPGRHELSAYLGAAATLWDTAIQTVREACPLLEEVWNFAGPKIGWSLRLVEKARVLVYLTPGVGQFRVGLVLGSNGVVAARKAGLSDSATAILDSAPKQVEGYGVRFQIASHRDMEPLAELIAIKLSVSPKRRQSRRGA